jgi:hypothetical protein
VADRDRAPPGSLDAHPAGAGRQVARHIALAGVALPRQIHSDLGWNLGWKSEGLAWSFYFTRRSRRQGLRADLQSVLASAFGGPDRLRCGV